jgi:DNA-binding MarR family transcriptional regulator
MRLVWRRSPPLQTPMLAETGKLEPGESPELGAALEYAERGWRVLPLRVGTKRPLVKWRTEATTDPVAIRAWWGQWPDAGVAVVTGNGLVVLDVDAKNRGIEALADLERAHAPLPRTVTVRTGGGGSHFYFSTDLPVATSAGKLGTGLDIRGEGGFVVAPPTLHASGDRYRFVGEGLARALAQVPAWIVHMSQQSSQPEAKRWTGSGRIGSKDRILRGGRNQALFRFAMELRFKGADREDIARRLLALNQQRCSPPLDADEVLRVATSAARYPSLLEELAKVEAAAAHHSERWLGRGGASDLAVLRAHIWVAQACRRMPYHADVRTLSNESGVSTSTVSRANERLVRSGWLIPHAERTSATDAQTWRVQIPPRLDSNALRDTQDSWGSSVPQGAEVRSADSRELDLSRVGDDVWRWDGGLGKSCQRVYQAILESPSSTEAELAARLGYKGPSSVRGHLNRLRRVGLAERLGDGRWTVGTTTPAEAARLLGVEGYADRQRERHKQERLDFRQQLHLLEVTREGVLFDPTTGEVMGRSRHHDIGDPAEYAVRRMKDGGTLGAIARELKVGAARPDWLAGEWTPLAVRALLAQASKRPWREAHKKQWP